MAAAAAETAGHRAPAAELGLGLLWRPQLAGFTAERLDDGRLGFVEVIAESVGPVLPPTLTAAREAGATVIPHGVSLGLGGAAPPDRRRLARLAAAAERCDAPLVSEHLAFVRAGDLEAGHLLPIPRTREALDVVVANVRAATGALPVPLALEPVATLVEWPGAELTELAFLLELLDRTEADLVLDVANVLVNAANRRRAGMAPSGPDGDPQALIEGLPLERVAYVHAAGGRIVDGRHHDTHADPLWPEVDALVEELWARHEIPGLLLERDGDFPDPTDLDGELARLATAADRGRRRRRRAAGASPPPPDNPPRPEPAPRTTSRQRLAAAQHTFLRATADGAPPAGFATDDLDAVTDVLVGKRAAAVAHAVPEVGALPAFAERFGAWARRHASRGVEADALGFLRSLPPIDRTLDACLAVARRPARRAHLRIWRNPEAPVVAARLGPWRITRAL